MFNNILLKHLRRAKSHATEYKLLLTLLQNQGLVLTREQLLEKRWDAAGNFVDEHTLSLNISPAGKNW